MDVVAVFEFPVPVWVMRDALDATYPTGFGPLRFNVVMPGGRSAFGEPPNVPGVAQSESTTDEPAVWVHEYGAFIPASLRPATALHRVAITDVEGPTPETRSWFTPDHQLAEFANSWFDEIRTWTEIATGQDLDPNHRVYDAVVVGTGLTFIEPVHEGSLGLTISTPNILPLPAHLWAQILGYVRDGVEPPLEEVLCRDARAAHRRNATRRAIIDAATALEVALGRYVRRRVNELPERQRNRLSDRTALGDFISIADHGSLPLAVPVEDLRMVSTLRNDAAHRGASPGHWDAGTAVQIVIDFLAAHGQVRRPGERERDGSEWVLVESDDDGP